MISYISHIGISAGIVVAFENEDITLYEIVCERERGRRKGGRERQMQTINAFY